MIPGALATCCYPLRPKNRIHHAIGLAAAVVTDEVGIRSQSPTGQGQLVLWPVKSSQRRCGESMGIPQKSQGIWGCRAANMEGIRSNCLQIFKPSCSLGETKRAVEISFMEFCREHVHCQVSLPGKPPVLTWLATHRASTGPGGVICNHSSLLTA